MNAALKNDLIYKQWQLSDTFFDVSTRYELEEISNFSILTKVGQGSYGLVANGRDVAHEKAIAVKKIEKAFEHEIYAVRTIRELKLQRILRNENVCISLQIYRSSNSMTQNYQPKSKISMICKNQSLYIRYIVTPLMETDLREIIKSNQQLSDDHIKFIIYQILRGLKYIHTSNVVHRDLKPRNILLSENTDAKICDFGFARTIYKQKSNDLSEYVTARWYRSPEVLLSWSDYTTSGVINILGSPEIASIKNSQYQKLLASIPKQSGKDFGKLFPTASKEAIDLMKRMLDFDIDRRITAEEALKHPYLSILHDPQDEPAGVPVHELEFEFENYHLTLEQLKDIMYEEILLYHSPFFKKQYMEKLSKGTSVYDHILQEKQSDHRDFNYGQYQYTQQYFDEQLD